MCIDKLDMKTIAKNAENNTTDLFYMILTGQKRNYSLRKTTKEKLTN